jgi:predicted AlkP superfamily pyrophosphatase or phosphodiesterase
MNHSTMLKKTVLPLLFFIAFLGSGAYSQTNEKPKLIIGITIDQMRYDYVGRFWDNYESDGFRKLVNQGYFSANTHYDHMPTYTGVGHATIGTGTGPSIHGIVGNDWYDRETKKMVYCVDDFEVTTVESETDAGLYSPKNLKSNTFADQLKTVNPKSKVFGIALKDRGAILPVGFNADAAYWFDGSNGKFITSSYYMDKLPAYMDSFNEQNLVEKYLSTKWETLLPQEKYLSGELDDMPFEGLLKGEKKPVFPHDLNGIKKLNGPGLIRQTPFGNTITFDLAKTIIDNENLGEDSSTDFLSVSLSSPDYIGHLFGPSSLEVEDSYVRLDRDIASFLSFIEKKLGKENILVFITSDHGVSDITGLAGTNAEYLNTGRLDSILRAESKLKFGNDLIEKITNDQIYIDREILQAADLDRNEVESFLGDILLNQNGISGVILPNQRICLTDESICSRAYNGKDPKRSGDIFFVKTPGWLDSYNAKGGTTHGSPFPYDTHVPLIWYGAGIKEGISHHRVHVKDIAPTLSSIMGISYPNGATGQPIEDLMDGIFAPN